MFSLNTLHVGGSLMELVSLKLPINYPLMAAPFSKCLAEALPIKRYALGIDTNQ
jgi:hypothetical protein